jgi:hypothetical protein
VPGVIGGREYALAPSSWQRQGRATASSPNYTTAAFFRELPTWYANGLIELALTWPRVFIQATVSKDSKDADRLKDHALGKVPSLKKAVERRAKEFLMRGRGSLYIRHDLAEQPGW